MWRASGQRPGLPQGSRAVVVPGDGPRPPAAWAPAVLTAHVGLLWLVAVVAVLPWTDDVASAPAAPPVRAGIWALAVLTAALVIRAVGRRHPGPLAYWLIGTAASGVVPVAWLAVASAADDPRSAGYYLLVLTLSPLVWLFLLPAVLIGAVITGVLAYRRS